MVLETLCRELELKNRCPFLTTVRLGEEGEGCEEGERPRGPLGVELDPLIPSRTKCPALWVTWRDVRNCVVSHV